MRPTRGFAKCDPCDLQEANVDVAVASYPSLQRTALRLLNFLSGVPLEPDIEMLIDGKCHCGNIAFELEWDGDPPVIPARACSCSFCIKHGGVWTSNPKSRLAVVIGDISLVSKYAF
jgi:hypothetical protein